MRSGIIAVLGAFAFNGVVLGSWAPRVPALAAQIDADEGSLGLALLGASAGMIAASILAGRLCAMFGARTVMTASGVAACALLPVVGMAASATTLGATLLALGATVGAMDVAMNVAAVTAIRGTGRCRHSTQARRTAFRAARELRPPRGSPGGRGRLVYRRPTRNPATVESEPTGSR